MTTLFAPRKIASVTSAAALIVAFPLSAQAAEDPMAEILAANPGVTQSEMEQDLGIDQADEATRERVLSEVLEEVRSHQIEAEESGSSGPSSRSSGPQEVLLRDAVRQGDIYWSPAGKLFVNYNHVGLYYTKERTIEAPGVGQVTQKYIAKKRKVTKGAQKKYIYGVSSATRLGAAHWAGRHLNLPYNGNFASNRKVESPKYNCSQYVWAAYMGATRNTVDLDRDIGIGVYPDDVKNAKQTRWYQTVVS